MASPAVFGRKPRVFVVLDECTRRHAVLTGGRRPCRGPACIADRVHAHVMKHHTQAGTSRNAYFASCFFFVAVLQVGLEGSIDPALEPTVGCESRNQLGVTDDQSDSGNNNDRTGEDFSEDAPVEAVRQKPSRSESSVAENVSSAIREGDAAAAAGATPGMPVTRGGKSQRNFSREEGVNVSADAPRPSTAAVADNGDDGVLDALLGLTNRADSTVLRVAPAAVSVIGSDPVVTDDWLLATEGTPSSGTGQPAVGVAGVTSIDEAVETGGGGSQELEDWLDGVLAGDS